MENYPVDFPNETAPQEDPVQYFCKFTFGQFFTVVVLLVVTLCFSFYVGARYGNQYLRIGEQGAPQVASVPALQQMTNASVTLPGQVEADEQLKQLARDALMAQQRGKLEGEMQQILATPPRPTTTSIPPTGTSEGDALNGAMTSHGVPAHTEGFPGEMVAAREGMEGAVPQQTPEQPILFEGGAPQGTEAPVQAMPPAQEAAAGGLVKVKSAGGMQYSVQIGAYQDQREAAYHVEEWKAKGYPAYMMIADLGERGRWYRVRLGGFPTKEDADHYLGDLRSKESINGIVVFNEQ